MKGSGVRRRGALRVGLRWLAALVLVGGAARPASAGCVALCVEAFSDAAASGAVGSIAAVASATPLFVTQGRGPIAITLSGPYSSPDGVAVLVVDGGEAAITTSGLVTASAGVGVTASSAQGPVHVVIGDGGVAATGAGVVAVSGGAGNLRVEGTGAIAAGTGAGVAATSLGGNVYINATGAIAGATGVSASTTGSGGLTVVTTGAVRGESGAGVEARGQDGLVAVVVGAGGVKGATDGVAASATGTGGLSLALGGDVAGASGAGLRAESAAGAIAVTVKSGVTAFGATAGVSVASASGAATIVNDGVITAGPGGAAFAATMGAGQATLVNDGAIRASQGGLAIDNRGGALAIANYGQIDGAAATAVGAATSLVNTGAWTNAGGSTISAFDHEGALSLSRTGAAVATLNVSGDATFGAYASTALRLGSASADEIAVAGAATIKGGVLSVTAAPGVYKVGPAYDLVTAGGGVSGGFTATSFSGGYLTALFSQTAACVCVTLGYGDIRVAARTPNERAVANALQSAAANLPQGRGGELLSSIYSLSGDAPQPVFDQLSGDALTGALNADLHAGSLFTAALADREELGRAAQQDDDAWWTGAAPRPAKGAWRAWSAGFGGAAAFNRGGAGAASQSDRIGGGAAGLEYAAGDGLVGVALGASQTRFAVPGRGASGSADGAHLGVYGRYAIGAFYAAGSLAGSVFGDKTQRGVDGTPGLASETEGASFSGGEARARVEVGLRGGGPALRIAPFGAVEAAALRTRSFVETTAGDAAGYYALSVAPQTTLSLPASFGVHIESLASAGGGVAIATALTLAVRHEFEARRALSAQFGLLPGADFETLGPTQAVNALQARLSVEARLSKRISLFVALQGDFARGRPSYSGMGGALVSW